MCSELCLYKAVKMIIIVTLAHSTLASIIVRNVTIFSFFFFLFSNYKNF